MTCFFKDSEGPEEVMLDVVAIEHNRDDAAHLDGHVLLLRTILRDGRRYELALTRTDCAHLYIRFRDDRDVLRWAAMLEQRADLTAQANAPSGSH